MMPSVIFAVNDKNQPRILQILFDENAHGEIVKEDIGQEPMS